MGQTKYPRHPKGTLTAIGASGAHLRIPWVTAWWSAALPGFGHLLISNHLRGFILILWELLVNTQAHINAAIVYSFTGKFQEAKEVLDHRWLILYIAVYVFALWDSYCETIEQNKYYIMAEREDYPITPVKLTGLEFGYGKKRTPLLAITWSLLTPGLGHFYSLKILEGFFLMACAMAIAYMSHISQAIEFSILGDFDSAKSIVNYNWLLFAPSLYGYAAYASYIGVVELNKFYDAEQARFLKQEYMASDFKMPI